MQIPTQAADQYTAAHLADLHARLADVRGWADSARKAALIEEYEEQIEAYEAALELGAELAEVIVERDEQAEEMERVAADLQARDGWRVRSSSLLVLMAFGPQGGSIDALALHGGGWLIQISHSGRTGRTAVVIVEGGELFDAMLAEMRGVEDLGAHKPHDWTSAYSADFPY